MHPRTGIAVLIAAALCVATSSFAQGINSGGSVGPAGVIQSPAVPPSAPPAGGSTGMSGGISQPGAPNSTTPGRIGSGASPSGLAGDNPSAPGFPGKVGR